eukprot:TRINITY_DN3737_c0_g1_i8.p1 TRINITY_DN3737_c0_g1~~TRINITY_DN3737_c0_g1_i8.p1  ORF type:complete len:1114 (+),score=209.77 TRINITY_DN3737_c0_g1_i8:1152-4493(+)
MTPTSASLTSSSSISFSLTASSISTSSTSFSATSKSSTRSSRTSTVVSMSTTSISHTASSTSSMSRTSTTTTQTTYTSTASSTTVTGFLELAAQVAVAATQKELQVLQEAEMAAVASLLNNMNSTGSGVIPQISQSVGNVTVSVFFLTAAAAGDGALTLSGLASNDAQPKVTVSPATLGQILGSSPQGVTVSMSSTASDRLGESLNSAKTAVAVSKGVDSKDSGVVKKIAKAPVSINIRDLSGNLIHVTFQEPLNISMGANASGKFECSFWNETLNTWSTEGVVAVSSQDGSIVCATTHLSLFGAFDVSALTSAVTCLTLDMFGNLDKLVRGAWIPNVGAIAFFVALLSHIALALLGCHRDRQNAHSRDYFDFFLENDQMQKLSVKAMIAAIFNIQISGRKSKEARSWARAGSIEGVSHAAHEKLSRIVRIPASKIITLCMHIVLGHKAGLHGIDLQALHKMRTQNKPEYFQMNSSRVQDGLRFLRYEAQLELDRFIARGFFQRAWMLFTGVQVFCQISERFSVFMTSQTIAELFALRFLVSVSLSAFVYYSQSVAEQLPPDHPCAPQDYGIIMNFLRGLVITLLCTIPSGIGMYLFQHASMRSYMRHRLDDHRRSWLVWRWTAIDTCLVWVRNALAIFLVFFVCLILASISVTDHEKWAYSFLYNFIQQYVTIPMATAAALAFATMLVEIISVEEIAHVRAEIGHWTYLPKQETKFQQVLDASGEQEAQEAASANEVVLDVVSIFDDPLEHQLKTADSKQNSMKPASTSNGRDSIDKSISSKLATAPNSSHPADSQFGSFAAARAANQRVSSASASEPTKEGQFVRTRMLAQEAEEMRQRVQHHRSKVESQTTALDQLISRLESEPPAEGITVSPFLISKKDLRSRTSLPLVETSRGRSSPTMPHDEDNSCLNTAAPQVEPSMDSLSAAMPHEGENLGSGSSVPQVERCRDSSWAAMPDGEENCGWRTSVSQFEPSMDLSAAAMPHQAENLGSRTSALQVEPSEGSASAAMPSVEENFGSLISVPVVEPSARSSSAALPHEGKTSTSVPQLEHPRSSSSAAMPSEEEKVPCEEKSWEMLGERYDEDDQNRVMLTLRCRDASLEVEPAEYLCL